MTSMVAVCAIDSLAPCGVAVHCHSLLQLEIKPLGIR